LEIAEANSEVEATSEKTQEEVFLIVARLVTLAKVSNILAICPRVIG
jgi:hypothetical protein